MAKATTYEVGMGQLIVFFGMIAMYIIGIVTGFDFDEDTTPIDEIQEMCPEIDELCEEDFIQLCDLYFPELDVFADIKEYVEFLEEEADVNGDTWRESDCGNIISQEQEEMREYNPWVNKPNILR